MACLTPFMVKDANRVFLPVPCGKCPACLVRRASAWSFRLLQEEKRSSSAYFLTLTYANENLPRTSKNFSTLSKPDVQKFLKRLRKLNPDQKLKYYLAGEYGTTTMRPHYHLIIFNADKDTFDKAWALGQTFTGTVSGASVGYTAKYINKGKVVPVHRNDDRLPEFSLMSKKLGANYMTPQIIKYHHNDLSRGYVTHEGGAKSALPRYFRDKIYSKEQKDKQSAIMASLHAEAQSKNPRTLKEEFEALKHHLENFKKRSNDNRKKI